MTSHIFGTPVNLTFTLHYNSQLWSVESQVNSDIMRLHVLDCNYFNMQTPSRKASCGNGRQTRYVLISLLMRRMSQNKCIELIDSKRKGRDLTQSYDKSPYTHRKIKRHKKFDYTTIVDWLRTVNWSSNSHPTGVVKPFYERSTIPKRPQTCKYQKDTHLKICKLSSL